MDSFEWIITTKETLPKNLDGIFENFYLRHDKVWISYEGIYQGSEMQKYKCLWYFTQVNIKLINS